MSRHRAAQAEADENKWRAARFFCRNEHHEGEDIVIMSAHFLGGG